MIERPTNDETYRTVRSRVLDDLRDKFRRARSDTPVVGIEDLALLRNVVRPALDQTKVGQSAREFLADGPLLPLLLKQAGAGTDYLVSQMREAAAGFGAAEPTPDQSTLEMIGSGIESVFKPFQAVGKGLYNVGQGLVGGALGGISSDALDWFKENLKPVDRVAEWVAGDVPLALASGGASALASGGKLFGSVALAGAKKAIPSLAGMVGRDALISTMAPAAITGIAALGRGASLDQAGQAAGQAVALPWAEEATQSAPAAANAVQDTVASAPSFDMSKLFNQNYWGGGGMSPTMAQGFSGEIGNLLKGFDPSMLGGLG